MLSYLVPVTRKCWKDYRGIFWDFIAVCCNDSTVPLLIPRYPRTRKRWLSETRLIDILQNRMLFCLRGHDSSEIPSAVLEENELKKGKKFPVQMGEFLTKLMISGSYPVITFLSPAFECCNSHLPKSDYLRYKSCTYLHKQWVSWT